VADIDVSMGRDEAWFRSLHARSGEALTRYALRRAASAADAEDVVAETFLVAWRRRDTVPEPPDDLLWLYGVARNTLSNVTRGERRRDRLRGRIAAEPPAAPAPDGDGLGAAVRDALSHLPPDDAELLLLIAWEELSHRELAAVFETTENAIALRASRAKRRLAGL